MFFYFVQKTLSLLGRGRVLLFEIFKKKNDSHLDLPDVVIVSALQLDKFCLIYILYDKDEEERCEMTDEDDDDKPTFETVELLKELSVKESRITDLENDVAELEQALTERGSMAELEELVEVVKMKNDRIEELEEALRESVRITADREKILQDEQMNRKHIMEKVGKLEQRLLSLQNAHALRCSICRPLVTRFKKMEKRLVHVLSERRKQLQDLARMK